MGMTTIKEKGLGIPQNSREVFDILAKNDMITMEMSLELKHMVGFRNLAVHTYQEIDLNIVESIITKHLSTLLQFSSIMLRQN